MENVGLFYDCFWYNLRPFGIMYVRLVYVHSLRSFGILFPFWYVWTKKNLATLAGLSCFLQSGTITAAADLIPGLNAIATLSLFFSAPSGESLLEDCSLEKIHIDLAPQRQKMFFFLLVTYY
jgi:hypothetical protein